MHVNSPSLVPASVVRATFGGVSESTLSRWSKAGEIPRPIKVGKVRLWDQQEFADCVEALKSSRDGGTR